MTTPVLTALVSTYASERHLRGCLDSLLAQTIGDRLEIVVVDACSPENEGAIVREYQGRHGNIRYVRTEQREGTSQSFRRGTAMASGRYLTTANADDRHRPDFAERMVAALDRHPELGIAYADSLITGRDNETWSNNTADRRYAWPDYTPPTALSCCLFGAQAVWRRSAHDAVGTWNPDYHYANDQDMFLRIALRFGAVHLREPLGLFLMRKDSVSGADNRQQTLTEVLAVMRKYRAGTPLEVLFPALRECPDDALARAAALFELGNLCALGPYTDAALALECYQRAAQLPLPVESVATVRAAFANNSACILACSGEAAKAGRALQLGRALPEAEANDRRLAAAVAGGRLPLLRELAFATLDHPVVRQSRVARGLEICSDGSTRWSDGHSRLPWEVFDGPNGVLIPAAPGAGDAERWRGRPRADGRKSIVGR